MCESGTRREPWHNSDTTRLDSFPEHTMAKGIAIAGGGVCPKCRRKMQRFTHPPGWEPKPGQPYFFLWWDVCKNKPAHRATHVQHYEEAKVHVDVEAPADPLLDHFRSI